MERTDIYFEQILQSMKETQEAIDIFANVVNELDKAFEEVALSADRLASFANELNN
ncbi:hypothetical protein ACFVT8_12325 [Lysinibacillus sp. NPDC058147]|uniref:hypothetical protein n=1 Tax=unclassified Lysinibacillus TaxID=2636778 RepID=UPI0036DE47B8